MMDHLPLRLQNLSQDVSVSLACANVLTLNSHAHAIDELNTHIAPAAQLTSGRRLDLAIQFEAAKLHIIGLQGTRCKAPRGWDILDFMALASGATQRGQGGIGIWIASQFLVARQVVFVLASDHRRLLVKIYTSVGILQICAAHALDVHTYTEQDVRTWWFDTTRTLTKLLII